jgi:hypothetical protein
MFLFPLSVSVLIILHSDARSGARTGDHIQDKTTVQTRNRCFCAEFTFLHCSLVKFSLFLTVLEFGILLFCEPGTLLGPCECFCPKGYEEVSISKTLSLACCFWTTSPQQLLSALLHSPLVHSDTAIIYSPLSSHDQDSGNKLARTLPHNGH